MPGDGRVLEALSRVMAALDRIERRLDEVEEALDSLATTIYMACLEERLGGFREVRRAGLPPGVSFVALGRDGRVYVGRARIVCGYEDASWLRTRGVHVAGLLGFPGEPVPVLVCSKYRGSSVPEGVRVIVC